MKRLVFVFALIIVSCKTEKKKEVITNNQEQKTMELSNKDKGIALIASLQSGDSKGASYINPNKYIQHNLAVADGLAGFGEVLKHAPEGGFKSEIIRAYQDGDYVFLHTVYDFFGPKIGFDILRFENGLIVEHWDNLLGVAPPNPSGHTQTDGPTTSTNLDETKVNKAIVKDFISTILMKGEMDKIPNYIDAGAENYIQHNPAIADGLSGLGKALEGMAKQGISMIYSKSHIILGEGNFVLAISEGSFANQATSFYDLFRVENGKIVEHWDVMETILPKSEWKNSNGKFNFPN
jgi:predicted SnoaL-like aldol condensation-catalyzing enzyme